MSHIIAHAIMRYNNMLLRKLAETIELSIDIPDDERKIAKSAIVNFEKLINKLILFNSHLNIIYNPFNEYETVSSESVIENRGAVWKYRRKMKENFNEIKKISLLCVKDLSHFDSDTHVIKLLSSFSDDIGGLENQVTNLLAILSNWETSNYKENVVSAVQLVKKEIGETKQLVYDRIIDHINTNMLARNWLEEVSDELNIPIKEREPIIIELYKNREKQLKER